MKCPLLIILALALSPVTHANSRYITAEHWKQLLEQESKNIVITGTIVKSKNLGFYKNFQYIAPDEATYKKLYPDDINAIYLEAITIKVHENVDPSVAALDTQSRANHPRCGLTRDWLLVLRLGVQHILKAFRSLQFLTVFLKHPCFMIVTPHLWHDE